MLCIACGQFSRRSCNDLFKLLGQLPRHGHFPVAIGFGDRSQACGESGASLVKDQRRLDLPQLHQGLNPRFRFVRQKPGKQKSVRGKPTDGQSRCHSTCAGNGEHRHASFTCGPYKLISRVRDERRSGIRYQSNHGPARGSDQGFSFDFPTMVIVPAHLLFYAQMMQQFAGYAAIFNRDDFCSFQKVDCPL